MDEFGFLFFLIKDRALSCLYYLQHPPRSLILLLVLLLKKPKERNQSYNLTCRQYILHKVGQETKVTVQLLPIMSRPRRHQYRTRARQSNKSRKARREEHNETAILSPVTR